MVGWLFGQMKEMEGCWMLYGVHNLTTFVSILERFRGSVYIGWLDMPILNRIKPLVWRVFLTSEKTISFLNISLSIGQYLFLMATT